MSVLLAYYLQPDTMDFWRREEGGDGCELVGEEMATLVGNGVCGFEETYDDDVRANYK